ncbi:MAG TPA: glutamate 5-kinase [Actinomycetota bacterium]|nr:glutamate 5-kinase [Actinomycetota bacterium]
MSVEPPHRRASRAPARRVVVKVGTTSLVDRSGRIARPKLARTARQIAEATRQGRQLVLVSSGAIASGFPDLGLTRRPRTISQQQAAAAVGQGRLMAEYLRLFARHDLTAAQVLLTRDDFIRRRQFVNAKATFQELLAAGVIPVVNENDTVSTDEIRFGDNDQLAALVAVMIGADLLVLLSDVDGIYSRTPGHRHAELLSLVTDPLGVRATGPRSAAGSGGMASKLQAAFMATAAGIPTVVANAAARDVLSRVLGGEEVGTRLPARAAPKRARKAWVAFVASPAGAIVVDAGAERALREAGRSLLAAGVVSVRGGFAAGDIVEVAGPHGEAFARGVTNYGATNLARGLDRPGTDQPPYDKEVIHRDELVLLEVSGWPRRT